MAWGLWRVPERELQLLGPVRGRSTLEVGCGAGRWSVALARAGAFPVGLDLSGRQLEKAHRVASAARARVRWVRGDAERLPFGPAAFDIVFADWGAFTFCDPRRAVPEAARVLRPGGRLVFATSSPFRSVVQGRRSDRTDRRLRYPYFALGEIRCSGEVNFQLTYADWIRLFRRVGLRVEELRELSPLPGRRSSYLSQAEERWGRRWPLESIWAASKMA